MACKYLDPLGFESREAKVKRLMGWIAWDTRRMAHMKGRMDYWKASGKSTDDHNYEWWEDQYEDIQEARDASAEKLKKTLDNGGLSSEQAE